MIVDDAILHCETPILLPVPESEQPVTVQLGGHDPTKLAEAARRCEAVGYREINLNVGCPSKVVAGKGCFGARLMYEPDKVAQIVRSMKEAVSPDIPITVKCRIGVDKQDSYEHLRGFVRTLADAGVTHLIVHARKAILNGLSTHANRRVPPLKYDFVYRLVEDFPHMQFTINGGVRSYLEVATHLRNGVAGVMVGRLAYNHVWWLAEADSRVFGVPNPGLSRRQVLDEYARYVDQQINVEMAHKPHASVSAVMRNMLKPVWGLFAGEANGSKFRITLNNLLAEWKVKEKELGKEQTMREMLATEMFRTALHDLDDAVVDAVPAQSFQLVDEYEGAESSGGSTPSGDAAVDDGGGGGGDEKDRLRKHALD
eukprot:jgi/Mesvir1/11725/Mv00105-RA.2